MNEMTALATVSVTITPGIQNDSHSLAAASAALTISATSRMKPMTTISARLVSRPLTRSWTMDRVEAGVRQMTFSECWISAKTVVAATSSRAVPITAASPFRSASAAPLIIVAMTLAPSAPISLVNSSIIACSTRSVPEMRPATVIIRNSVGPSENTV